MPKREVPARNYILFAIVAMISFIVVFNLAIWYKDIKEEYESQSIISEVVFEVYPNDIETYIVENESFVLYLNSSRNIDLKKEYETEFKDLIIGENISDKIIYLDTKNITDGNFYRTFALAHSNQELLDIGFDAAAQPNLFYFKDHRIVDVLYSETSEFNIDAVEQFLIVNEVIE